jgi:hypothetical protein
VNYTEQEYLDFREELVTRFPVMFSGRYGGFSIDQGWWPILSDLCEKISGYLDENPQVSPVIVVQVKEKYGGLRFYYDGGDTIVDDLVRAAEEATVRTCEVCGKPGEIQSIGGWLKCLCDEHFQLRMEERRQRRMVVTNGQ